MIEAEEIFMNEGAILREHSVEGEFTPASLDYRNLASLIRGGYLVNNKPVVPVSGHLSDTDIFDTDKLAADIQNRMRRTNFTSTSTVTSSSFTEFASSVSAKATLQGENKLNPQKVKGSLATELNLSTKGGTRQYYSQHRSREEVGSYGLDSGNYSNYMTESTKTAFKSIQSKDDAARIVNNCGIGFFGRVIFGGIYTGTCRMDQSTSFTSSDFRASLRGEFSNPTMELSGGTEINIEMSNSQETQTVTTRVRVVGGNTRGTLQDWKDSVNKDSEDITVVAYNVIPLHVLLGRSGLNLSDNIIDWVKDACQDVLTAHERGLTDWDHYYSGGAPPTSVLQRILEDVVNDITIPCCQENIPPAFDIVAKQVEAAAKTYNSNYALNFLVRPQGEGLFDSGNQAASKAFTLRMRLGGVGNSVHLPYSMIFHASWRPNNRWNYRHPADLFLVYVKGVYNTTFIGDNRFIDFNVPDE